MTATLTLPSEQIAPRRDPFSHNTQTYDPAASAGIASANWLLAAAQAAFEQRASGHTTAGIVRVGRWPSFETRSTPVLASVAPPSPLGVVKKAAAARFAAIPQVAYIFCDIFQSAPVFSVFVEGEHYDDAVMDQLLNVELVLHQQFTPARLTFNYLPHSGGADPRHTIRDTAQCLFERKHGRPD